MAESFVDIWYADFVRLQDCLGEFAVLLDDGERQKAGLFKSPLLRDRYIAVRGLLRTVLASYLVIDPSGLRFISGEYGKPGLIGDAIHFNLSHSAQQLVIAVSDRAEVGVDIEQVRERKGLLEMARRCFAAREFVEWCNLSEYQQPQAFYRLWTKKEAFVKAVGRGIALGLDRCEFDMAVGGGFVDIPADFGFAEDWFVKELSVESGFCAAMVVRGGDVVCRYRSFE